MKTLIVEDDRTLADILAFTFIHEGFEVVQAYCGNDALQLWEDENPDCNLANSYNDETGNYCVGDTSAVGSCVSGASQYDVMDMAGNVWEWVADWFQWNYYTISPYKNPIGPSGSDYGKVLRGGSWYRGWSDLRVVDRYYREPFLDGTDLGFRCASDSP